MYNHTIFFTSSNLLKVVEDVQTVVEELIGEEGVGHEELTDGDKDVEELADEEHVGVGVELVVNKLEIVAEHLGLLLGRVLHGLACKHKCLHKMGSKWTNLQWMLGKRSKITGLKTCPAHHCSRHRGRPSVLPPYSATAYGAGKTELPGKSQLVARLYNYMAKCVNI